MLQGTWQAGTDVTVTESENYILLAGQSLRQIFVWSQGTPHLFPRIQPSKHRLQQDKKLGPTTLSQYIKGPQLSQLPVEPNPRGSTRLDPKHSRLGQKIVSNVIWAISFWQKRHSSGFYPALQWSQGDYFKLLLTREESSVLLVSREFWRT